MSKKILILVVSSNDKPYKQMVKTSLETWDSIDVENCETMYYFGEAIKDDLSVYIPNQNPKFLFDSVKETYSNMGHKLLYAFQWVLRNKDFDYIVRINSSCYCDKKHLVKYIETLPETNVFAGVKVGAGEQHEQPWIWGGGQFILSKDVVEKVVEHKHKFNHNLMEDVALSFLINDLEIPYTEGSACSINKQENGWLLLTYGGGEQKEFKDFEEIKDCGQHFYRVKHDPDRSIDAVVMNELYRLLK